MIGDKIRQYRVMAKMSQAELASRLNVKQVTVSSWETNRTEPNMGYIEQLSKILCCRKSDLIGDNKYEDEINYILQPKISEEEMLILSAYNNASPANKIKALALLLGKEL